jgi:hypothetical protein
MMDHVRSHYGITNIGATRLACAPPYWDGAPKMLRSRLNWMRDNGREEAGSFSSWSHFLRKTGVYFSGKCSDAKSAAMPEQISNQRPSAINPIVMAGFVGTWSGHPAAQ